MKKFKFTLQSVLNLKENIREEEKRQLMILQARLNILNSELDALNNLYRKTTEELKEKSQKGITTEELFEYSYYIKEIDRQITLKKNEIVEMQAKIQAQTETVKQIMVEVKSLEKLREAQKKDYDAAENKEIELSIEDFVSGRMSLVSEEGI